MELPEYSPGVKNAEMNRTKELLHNDNDGRKTPQRRKTSSTQGFKT